MKKLSQVGNGIIGSEIIKISQQIKEISKEKQVLNLTIGDFDPKVNPIPARLRDEIIRCYEEELTNYPMSPGELGLRSSVSRYLKKRQGIEYNESEILIGGGVRPLIYTVYKSILDEGDTVVYPVPSWNNNHYTFLHHGYSEPIECKPENSFFPTVEDIKRTLNEARLICICSPQNPTGRIISSEVLKGICEAIVQENKKRDEANYCYLFFDQIYSDLSQDGKFTHPILLCPEIREWLICADGISKSLCATGIRVGWLFGPKDIIGKMSELFSHIGAWAPKPEQNAVARYLDEYNDLDQYISTKKKGYRRITEAICQSFETMKKKGFAVDYQVPEGGIYISIYLDYVKSFDSVEEYISFLISDCGLGVVPFEYFGAKSSKGWWRISIGNIAPSEISSYVAKIEEAVFKSHQRVNSMVM
jgi:aspartate aminotransferase